MLVWYKTSNILWLPLSSPRLCSRTHGETSSASAPTTSRANELGETLGAEQAGVFVLLGGACCRPSRACSADMNLSRAQVNTKLGQPYVFDSSCFFRVPSQCLPFSHGCRWVLLTSPSCCVWSRVLQKNVRPLELLIWCCVVCSFREWLLNQSSQTCC